MNYRQIKWFILIVPTITVGLWEYIRHQFLLPYISMSVGNYLTPVLVFLVSITLLSQLFSMLEKIQRELERERTAKVALEAREQLAKELHDGIAQTLFLLSVKVDRLEFDQNQEIYDKELYKIRKAVHEVNHYVRQSIANLKYTSSDEGTISVNESLEEHIKQIANEVLIEMKVDWSIQDHILSTKEKAELLACIREAVVNIQKHAFATTGWINGWADTKGWTVKIEDNGRGLPEQTENLKNSYGIAIMKERAADMGWKLTLHSDKHTKVILRKGGE
ncbi:sensor histidine kinase [Paenibacillus terrae]|uniref:histidine kinase n=1 Tax=Paenibacillus terrae TaxID=159743 RepID=A0A0D7X3G8_9BACL|nr:histidine kinase [Paenibacillus terrae]KJD45921.1 histidine kinase [Paenibacillus terrae]